MALLTLGNIAFDGFEVPARVRFGGAQRTAVHKLLGGGRAVDTMGRDDHSLVWSGILSGNNASGRARALDAMRVAGNVLPLAWDAFCYDVVVVDLTFEFCSPWWITYKIACIVVMDLAQSVGEVSASTADTIIADLTTASTFLNVGALLASATIPGALVDGASGLPSLIAGLSTLQASVGPGIAAAENNLDSADLSTLVSSSGTMAQLCAGAGYLGRSLTNLEDVLS